MNNKISNIKTFSDINANSQNNVSFYPAGNIGSIISKIQHIQAEDKINIEESGKILGGNRTRDIRKARLSYYNNLLKNSSKIEQIK